MATAGEFTLRISIENLLEGVQIIGFNWTYLYVNNTACVQGQRSQSDLLGRTMMACYPGIERTDLFAALQRVMTTRQSERMLNEFVYSNGERGWFEVLIDPVPDGICMLSVDISERQRVQAQLRQAQRMEAIGQLAGGIAHDFNNALTAILGYCDLLLERVQGEHELSQEIGEIRLAGEHAAGLTRQLLAFSRKQVLRPEVLDLNRVVVDLSKMLSRVIGDDVRLQISTTEALSHTRADPSQVEQVLMNLVVNARDAMPQGGTVHVSTTNVVLDDAFVRDQKGAVAGRFVALVVEDSGDGMTADILARAFEPFFTTKGPGKGTGLGLATVYGIVKQSGGYIWMDSTLGVGTTATIYLPAVDDPLTQASPPPIPAARLGTETILLVEDNVPVRAFMRRVLRTGGYTVLEAQDTGDALGLAETHRSPIDLLVSDIVMPGMNGPNLAQLLLGHQPAMKVLYVSGFPLTAMSGLPSNNRRIGFLSKPFGPSTFLSTVRQSLDA